MSWHQLITNFALHFSCQHIFPVQVSFLQHTAGTWPGSNYTYTFAYGHIHSQYIMSSWQLVLEISGKFHPSCLNFVIYTTNVHNCCTCITYFLYPLAQGNHVMSFGNLCTSKFGEKLTRCWVSSGGPEPAWHVTARTLDMWLQTHVLPKTHASQNYMPLAFTVQRMVPALTT